MKLTKTIFTFLLIAIFSFSCSDDDESCTAPELSANIIGEFMPEGETDIIEFQADGTLIDPNGAFVSVNVNDVEYDQKTWSLSGTTLTTVLKTSSGVGESSFDFEVVSNECDKIKLDVFGISYTLFKQ